MPRWYHETEPSICKTALSDLPRNFINDRMVFWVCAASNNLAMKCLSYSPAWDVVRRYRIKEAFFFQCLGCPFDNRRNGFVPVAMTVCGFLYPDAEFRGGRISILQPGNA